MLFDEIDPDDIVSVQSLAQHWVGASGGVPDPELIFETVWGRLLGRAGGDEAGLRLPCEILFLGGAPGAGKGTMTPYIMASRGLTAEPIVMSALLESPAALKMRAEGGLADDTEVSK